MSGFDFDLIVEYLPDFWRGAKATIFYSLTSLGLAVAIGLVVALCRISHIALLRLLARTYIDAIRGTPALIQIFFVYFGMPAFGVNLSAPTAAVIALGINSGGYLAEIFRAGIMGVDPGPNRGWSIPRNELQHDHVANYPCRRPPYWSFRRPPGSSPTLVKGTSLLSTISVAELTRVAQQIVGVTFRPIEAYVAIGVIYYCLNAVIAQGAVWLERSLRRSQGLK